MYASIALLVLLLLTIIGVFVVTDILKQRKKSPAESSGKYSHHSNSLLGACTYVNLHAPLIYMLIQL